MRVRCTTRVEPFPWGTALFNDRFPKVWDLNFLRVDRPSGVSAAQLIAEAERMMGAAGLDFRQLEVLGEPGSLLAPAFLELNWWVFKALFMGLRQAPDRLPSEPGVARECTWDEMRKAEEIDTRRQPFGKDPETVRQLLDRTIIEAEATHLRCFGAEADGMVVSYCYLYSDGTVAQIERVATMEEYQGRGLSRAVVQAAIDTARAENHELIFLVADGDDWPKEFYGKLGFDPLGVCYSFRRVPEEDHPGTYL